MKTIKFKRVNNDVYGNPRYVCHFFALLREEEKSLNNYSLACNRAHKIGGKKYRGKDYGGGIVFQSYNLNDLVREITELVNNA